MKKVIIITSAVLISTVLILVYIYRVSNVTEQYNMVIYKNWNIFLPDSYTEIYSADSGTSIQGDGPRYHVFQYKSNNEIGEILKWRTDKNTDMESATNEVLKRLNVSDKDTPDFQKNYKYYTKVDDMSKLYLIYFSDTKKLYIVEDLF